MKNLFSLILALAILFANGAILRALENKAPIDAPVPKRDDTGRTTPLKLTILYDNYVFAEGTKADWGFSCLIEGTKKTILFDTGGKSDVLFHNINHLKVNLKKVDLIVISHNHWDHTGGLASVLEKNHDVCVYTPHSFPHDFVEKVEQAKAKVIPVKESTKICEDVYLTGEMGQRIKEQSLQFKELGVAYCGATHCTGDEAIALFKEAYGENYVQIGTGRILTITDKGLR